MFQHRIISLASTLLFLCLASGCGDSKETSTKDKLQIAVIPKGTTHVFWKSIHAGAVKASIELNVDVIWQGPQKEDDRNQQIQVVQNFASRGVDAIVLAPLDAKALIRPVESARKRGIKTIIIDSALEGEAFDSFVATDNFAGGKLCAKRLADISGEKPKVVMLRYMEGSASTDARERGFLEGIAEYAPGAELLSTNQYTGTTVEKALQAAQNLLNRFEKIDAIFCPNESSAVGMLRALEISGKAGKIKFVGFDYSDKLEAGMRAGFIDGLALQSPFNMGYLGVKSAVESLQGKKIKPRIDTGVILATPQNLDSPKIKDLVSIDLDKWLKVK
jgi:ribose transport system substrate-binding protein